MPDHIEILRQAVELSRAGRKSEAIELIAKSWQNPDLADAPRLLGEVIMYAGTLCEQVGDNPRAHMFYQNALSLMGDDPGVLYALGEVCIRLNDLDSARAYFRRCHAVSEERANQDYLQLLELKSEVWK
jgi:tetratricopeptide (TPR) repeat protein